MSRRVDVFGTAFPTIERTAPGRASAWGPRVPSAPSATRSVGPASAEPADRLGPTADGAGEHGLPPSAPGTGGRSATTGARARGRQAEAGVTRVPERQNRLPWLAETDTGAGAGGPVRTDGAEVVNANGCAALLRGGGLDSPLAHSGVMPRDRSARDPDAASPTGQEVARWQCRDPAAPDLARRRLDTRGMPRRLDRGDTPVADSRRGVLRARRRGRGLAGA